MQYLVETALLTHGLRSVSQEMLAAAWPFTDSTLCWVEQGKIVRGTMAEYLPFREKNASLIRIDCYQLDTALEQGLSGALTASGTMEACHRMGIPLAVSCGIGGIGDIKGEELCPDLPALSQIPTALLATAPKDMLDIPATIGWLLDHGVHVAGDRCTGYLFHSADVTLGESLSDYPTAKEITQAAQNGGLLLLQPMAERIEDDSILTHAIVEGKHAEAEGRYFHPAVNGEIDRLTQGRSSVMQLASLIENVRLAASL